jgi:hypothetical protein
MTKPCEQEQLLEILDRMLPALELLADEVSRLRLAVDDLTTELEWRNNQDRALRVDSYAGWPPEPDLQSGRPQTPFVRRPAATISSATRPRVAFFVARQWRLTSDGNAGLPKRPNASGAQTFRHAGRLGRPKVAHGPRRQAHFLATEEYIFRFGIAKNWNLSPDARRWPRNNEATSRAIKRLLTRLPCTWGKLNKSSICRRSERLKRLGCSRHPRR